MYESDFQLSSSLVIRITYVNIEHHVVSSMNQYLGSKGLYNPEFPHILIDDIRMWLHKYKLNVGFNVQYLSVKDQRKAREEFERRKLARQQNNAAALGAGRTAARGGRTGTVVEYDYKVANPASAHARLLNALRFRKKKEQDEANAMMDEEQEDEDDNVEEVAAEEHHGSTDNLTGLGGQQT
jgi:hypothetical protein